MKTLSILAYIIGSVLLIVSCFTAGVTLTWILGAVATVFLIIGCILQFQITKKKGFSTQNANKL